MKNILYGILLGLMFKMSISLAKKNCDKLGVLLYEDIGCSPKNTLDYNGCPSEYMCPSFNNSGDKCYYKNQTLRIGEARPDSLCYFGCICDKGGEFICPVIVDCPEIFGITPPPGCYSTHDLNSCCPVGQICGKKYVTCEYDGKTYKEGIRFYPKDSCSMCVCQKGFRGKIEAPFCKRLECYVQLEDKKELEQKCAPVYNLYDSTATKNDILCCPGQWVCAQGNETVTGKAKSDKVCYFGKQKLNVGQKIETTSASIPIVCECKIPPLLTCLRK